MRDRLELDRLSLAERDRRWAVTRAEMKARGLDALVLWGMPVQWDFATANARYLCPVGGNAEYNTLIFPLEGDPTCLVLMPTFLEYWKRAQDWVPDIRPKKGPWAACVAASLRERRLDCASIGIDGLAGPLDADGWLPYSVFADLKRALPDARFVDLDDMMEKIRATKSAEEVAALDRAASLGDMMLQACRDTARPGVREAEVHASMMQVMLANGGEEPTLFLWAADRYPLPHPFRLPTMRRLEKHDQIICELHPKAGGYFTHVERTYCLGEPDPNTVRIYEVCTSAYERAMRVFGPGKSIPGCMKEAEQVVRDARLAVCEMGFHGHGLGALEYPRFRLHAVEADRRAMAAYGDTFREGMVFAFNIDLFDPNWRDGKTGAVFAETILITATGARRFHSFPTGFQHIEV